MRYKVYVATAAQFVADLYAALGAGAALGEAVSRGRKQLQARPERSVAGDTRPLQDWPVPVVYEAAPVTLFPPRPREPHVNLALGAAAPAEDAGFHNLPRRPDVGFFGRDETLLALDRAFDDHRIVLLHAYAGSGKTTAVAEFARWYKLTGGVKTVLFTSFEQRTTWQHTAHAFGYLAPAPPGDNPLPIRHAGNIAPNVSLKNARVKITLDRLRVAAYPGGGTHRVLFDFSSPRSFRPLRWADAVDARAWLGEVRTQFADLAALGREGARLHKHHVLSRAERGRQVHAAVTLLGALLDAAEAGLPTLPADPAEEGDQGE